MERAGVQLPRAWQGAGKTWGCFTKKLQVFRRQIWLGWGFFLVIWKLCVPYLIHKSPFLQSHQVIKRMLLGSVGASCSSSLTFAGVGSDGWCLSGFSALGLGVKNIQPSGRRDFCSAAPRRLTRVPDAVEEAAGNRVSGEEWGASAGSWPRGTESNLFREEQNVFMTSYMLDCSLTTHPRNTSGHRSRLWKGMVPWAADLGPSAASPGNPNGLWTHKKPLGKEEN